MDVSDSLGDSLAADVPDPSNLSPFRYAVQDVSFYHLVRAAVTGGMAQVTLNAVQNGSSSGALAGSTLNAAARFDNREVTISCPTIHDDSNPALFSQHKGLDASGNPVPVADTRNSDGSIQADSAVTWNNDLGQWTVPGVQFYANATNFSNPSYQWSVSGDGDLSNETQAFLNTPGASSNIPVGIFFSDENAPWNSQIKCNVTDSDSAQGANSFGVTWHQPYEPVGLTSSTNGKEVFQTRISGVAPSDFAAVEDSPAATIHIRRAS